MLTLCEEHGLAPVQAAVEEALGHPEVSLATVRYQLRAARAADSPAPAQVTFDGPSIEQGSAAAYGSLIRMDSVGREVKHA